MENGLIKGMVTAAALVVAGNAMAYNYTFKNTTQDDVVLRVNVGLEPFEEKTIPAGHQVTFDFNNLRGALYRGALCLNGKVQIKTKEKNDQFIQYPILVGSQQLSDYTNGKDVATIIRCGDKSYTIKKVGITTVTTGVTISSGNERFYAKQIVPSTELAVIED
jgi:hypothetical protein